jgi:tetratricopeptide (TPR) repeat protein
MIGAALGPYRLDRELGAGGMGTVWLATVIEDAAGVKAGAKVAIKIVHPHLLERAGFFKRFMREAEIGRTVRHEAVVRTFDVDALSVDGKQIHFMVMEYVEGKTLRALLDELKTVPETLLREIARQVAAGLAAIHTAGIVHRDLKPENVLITPDHVVKVMDLGVARLMEESVALTREGSFAGSLLYAAPEQFGGKPVGPAVDLYSVGVMLYELASGENPFQRDGAGAVMAAHMKETPPRLSDRNSEVSPFLAEVVGTLLAKEPAGRFGSAEAFRDVLVAGERSTWWGERERVLLKEEGHLPKIAVRRETALHGREDAMALLADAWKSAKAGRGAMVLVEGEAGIGKTRVVDAFLQRLKGEDAHVLYGGYPPSGGAGGLTDALIARFGTAGMEEALRPYLTVTPRLVPAFAAMVQHETPPPGAEPLSADAVHAVFVHLMKALAAEKPLLWLVDDLHFSQAESRKIVLALARALEGHRALLVVTTRPGLAEDEVSAFSRLPDFKKAVLVRLSPRQVIELLKDAFRSAVLAERLGGKIAYKSDGIPYFVFEMIRGLKEGNFIKEAPDGTYVETQVVSDIEVPDSVKDLIEARLKGLSDDDRNLLNVAAVQGVEFDPDLVATVCEVKMMKALERFSSLERHSGVVRGSGDTCRFDHNQIQEVLYGALMPRLRKEYHAALAEAYAEREGIDAADVKSVPGPACHFLARHHLQGSRPKNGVLFLVPAVEHLRNAYRDEEALDLVEHALAAPGLLVGDDRLAALLRAGSLRRDRGRPADGTAALEEAVALADAGGDPAARARGRNSLGQHLVELGQLIRALTVAESGLALARQAGDGEAERSIELNAANCLWRLGRTEEARARYERLLELVRDAADAQLEASVVGNLGAVCSVTGRHAEGREYQQRSLELGRRVGDRRNEAVRLGNLGELDRADGNLAAALDRYLAGERIGREAGVRRHEAFASFNIAETLLTLGDLDRAAERIDAGARMAREIGNQLVSGWGRRIRGDFDASRGDVEAARLAYDEALRNARAISSSQDEAEALLGLARLDENGASASDAAARLDETIARAAEDPNVRAVATAIRAALPGGDPAAAAKTLFDLGERPWHVARMEARFWLWKATNDCAHLAESWRLLVHLRDHAPPEYKVTVMENVPLHREIAAAAKEAGL